MIRVERLRKQYGRTLAVDDITFEARPGEIFGLLGPNGAGKTTTISVLAGLIEPTSGSALIDGLPIGPSAVEVKQRLGVVPQEVALYDDLNARENLAFWGSLYGLAGAALKGRVDVVLKQVGLSDRAGDRVKTYSGGMKRRLNLALGLVHEPKVVLLDEPTVGVDPQSRNAIFDSIEVLKAQGRTLVYSTHYMEEAVRLCDRVAIIDAGRVLALDTVPGLIRTHGGTPSLQVRQAGRDVVLQTYDPLAELNRLSLEAPVESFRVDEPTLEQVFLSLTGRTLRD